MAKRMGLLSNAQNKIMKMNYYKVLNSRFLLYFILLLALVDLFYFAMERDFLFCGIFILIGFLTSFFSKNIMVILVITIALTNILRFGKNATISEGMESAEETEETEEEVEEGMEDGENEEVEEGLMDETSALDELKKKTLKGLTPSTGAKASSTDMTKGLDDQTANLINQQKTLMKNMESLTPLLQNAETFMEKFQSLNA